MLDRELAPGGLQSGRRNSARGAGSGDSEFHGRVRQPHPKRRALYPVSRVHLDVMTDDVGLWQHARGDRPDRTFGYCTDDVAREIVVDVLHARELGRAAVQGSLERSLRFVGDAFRNGSGRFMNMRDANGKWLDVDASEDCHARSLVGLAAVIAEMPGTDMAGEASSLFVRAIPAATAFGSLRPISAALIACDSVMDAISTGEAKSAARATFELLADRLADAAAPIAADWPWPENVLTYENALLPQALITAGGRPGGRALLDRGCALLDWLIDVQTTESGSFSPIGNSGWWPRGGARSRFDQQPIEAAVMVATAASAFRATGRRRYVNAAEAAYGWFLGDNDLGIAMADPALGGCFDGLQPTGPNANQGAESTLMWLGALEQIRRLRGADNAGLHAVASSASGGDPRPPTGRDARP